MVGLLVALGFLSGVGVGISVTILAGDK